MSISNTIIYKGDDVLLDARAQKLVASMPNGFEAALIGTEINRYYLLGYDAWGAGTLLLLPEKMVYIVDSRYIEGARKVVKNAEVMLETDAMAQLKAELEKAGVKKLYLEDGMTLAAVSHLKKAIPGVEYDESSTLSKAIVALRAIKEDIEVARMRKAQQITDECFSHILPFIKEGVRELDIALEMEFFMRSHGAEAVAFDIIAVAGQNTSLPHGVPGDYRVQKGDLITLDFGAKYDGYCADMTRTVALGEPGEEKRKLYNTVLKAHLAGIEAAGPGKTGREVDKVARDIIDATEFAGRFGHGLGHAVGMEVHESPRFSPKSDDIIKPGVMITVEPGIYLEGKYGCRIEDVVLITETGCEPLPKSPKELIVL